MIVYFLLDDIDAIFLDVKIGYQLPIAIGNIFKDSIELSTPYCLFKLTFSKMNHNEMCRNLSVVSIILSGVLF